MSKRVNLPPLVFGIILVVIWGILQLTFPALSNYETLGALQYNLIAAISRTSVQTALLTAGLISIAFSFVR